MNAPKEFPASPSDAHVDRLSDPNRLAALEQSGLMDSRAEDAFDRAVRLATLALGKPVGLFSLVDTERQFFKAQAGLVEPLASQRETRLSHSFCQYVTTEDVSLAISDARKHPLLQDNGAVPDLGVIAYMGVPVHAPDGQALGSFCVIDNKPHDWTPTECAILEDIAGIVETELALRQEVAQRVLLARELNHRVKNVFAVMGGLIGLTARASATVEDLTTALRNRIGALARAHDLIRPAVDDDPGERRDVALDDLVRSLISPHLGLLERPKTIAGDALMLRSDAATNLALILNEFATNAAKYGALSAPGGHLSVTWAVTADRLVLDWVETGVRGAAGPPQTRGFGSQLVELTLRGHFRGESETVWTADGVHRRLILPMATIAALTTAA